MTQFWGNNLTSAIFFVLKNNWYTCTNINVLILLKAKKTISHAVQVLRNVFGRNFQRIVFSLLQSSWWIYFKWKMFLISKLFRILKMLIVPFAVKMFSTSCATHIKFAYIYNLLECTTKIFIDHWTYFLNFIWFSLQWTC